MSNNNSAELPALTPEIVALAMALCDLLLHERAKLRATLGLLKAKGLLTEEEIAGILSTPSPQPALAEAESEALQAQLRERIAIRLQELALHLGGGGPIQ